MIIIFKMVIPSSYDHLHPGQWLWTSTTQPPWSALQKEALRWKACHDDGANDDDADDDVDADDDDHDDDDDDNCDDGDGDVDEDDDCPFNTFSLISRTMPRW